MDEEKAKTNKEKMSEAEKEAEKHKQEAIEKSHNKSHPIKEKAVNELVEKMKSAKTIMIVNIKGLPSKQYQDIKKSIREHAQILVSKKNIIKRAIEKFGKKEILPLEEKISENCAIAISDMEGYELAGILVNKKIPASAKAGQISPKDIEVKEGPTDLVPGPAISELGSAGLQVAVEDGKLTIKAPKVIVTAGQLISENIASILQKLKITPFKVGLEPIAIYEVETGKIYTEIKINPEEAKASLVSSVGKALGFAQKIVYYCKETIGYLLAKANAEGDALKKFSSKEEKAEEEKPNEEKTKVGEKTEEEKKEEQNSSDTQLNNPEENA